jgi:hypothetical protein
VKKDKKTRDNFHKNFAKNNEEEDYDEARENINYYKDELGQEPDQGKLN